jgi:5-methylcytosine-specific restriction endonuclease McrA
MEQYKTCTKCRQSLPSSSFSKCSSKKDGLHSNCRACRSSAAKAKRLENPEEARAKAKEWRDQNKDKTATYFQTYKQKNPEGLKASRKKYYDNNRDALYQKNKDWAIANPDKVAAKQERWRKNNPDKVADKKRRYYLKYSDRIKAKSRRNYQVNPELAKVNRANWIANNPEKRAASRYKRRSQMETPFVISANEISRLYKSPCAYCGSASEHLDHVIPLSRGGEHRIGNLVGACAKCNLSKNDKFIMEWRLWKLRSATC